MISNLEECVKTEDSVDKNDFRWNGVFIYWPTCHHPDNDLWEPEIFSDYWLYFVIQYETETLCIILLFLNVKHLWNIYSFNICYDENWHGPDHIMCNVWP